MKLGIIVGSTRQGRISHHLAKAVADAADKTDGAEVEVLDLRDYDLPFFNEASSPKYNPGRKPEAAVRKWLDKLAEKDAYVIVTPEYNRAIPGVLKNAFDHIAYEMAKKPAAIVSHGSFNGGFAQANVRIIISELGAVPTPTFMGLPYGAFAESGHYDGDADELKTRLKSLLEELKWFSDTLATSR